MRLDSRAATLFVLALVAAFGFRASGTQILQSANEKNEKSAKQKERNDGQAIFRFDTFGDEQLWTDVLRMHEVVATLPPTTALDVGLKVDAEALPDAIVEALKAGQVDLTNPAVTVELLRHDAVVGVKGQVSDSGELTSIGITCALCHSTVDDSFAPGIGRRLDGWANTSLNVGAIVALSPSPMLDDDTKKAFGKWGPGKYDPRHHAFNGASFLTLNSESLPVVIPPIYGLKGVGYETYTADGRISYWNSYVGVGQMGGHGTFIDLRPPIGLSIIQTPDMVTPKLPALLDYQLSLRTPEPPDWSFDREAARRGRRLFRNEAQCATCHQRPNFTDVLSGPARNTPFLHDPAAVGTETEYAARSATGQYRTTPLRALWQHPPYFHDGSAPDLPAVVEHYNQHFSLNLTPEQASDLVEFLKSL
jgi:mono/diheme cytochrome c family protein